MALGVPCVSTWVNGVPELIRDGIDGYTVAPGDSAALADAIERLMSDEGRRESLARAGRQRAEEVVDLSKNVGQLAALFEKYLTAKIRDNRVLASTIASH
jgi:glycosyltransferase involved in cell wall biosynthesis